VEQSAPEVVVGAVGDVPPGTTRKFWLATAEGPVEAFVVNFRGELHGWVNRCRHVPLTMDWVENRFLDASGEHIVCATHGGLYRPDTGECVAGPPFGKVLIRVPLRIEGGQVVATTPTELAATPARP
jgi:nitrite reductase/ring-hydroxylating ferredoxin subunit